MPQVVAYDSVAAGTDEKEVRAGRRKRTLFMCPEKTDVQGDPYAFLFEISPQFKIRTHFHRVDEFQIIVNGSGVMGRHALPVHTVHFARADTPYGPIVAGEQGLGFLTLRLMRDSTGRHHFPEAEEELRNLTNRDPWQASEMPEFASGGGPALRPFKHLRNEHGLAAYSMTLAPGAKLRAPDPATSAGQYLIITRGSLKYQGRDHDAITIVFVKPGEQPFELEAGADGLDALVLSFPQPATATARRDAKAADKSSHRVWKCQLCAFIYDEARGMPEEGIAAGTRWEDVPQDWYCPDCSARKDDFDMQVVA